MSLSSVLEISLGLILVYYVASSIVSAITGQIAQITRLRAANLERGLYNILADSGRYEQIFTHPLIQSLSKRRVTLFGPVQVQGVDFIPSQTFALTLFDVLAPGAKDDDPQALAVLREAVFVMPEGKTRDALMGLLNSGVNTLEQAQERVAGWFDCAMESVSDLYAQYARRIVVIVAAVIILVLGVDSVDIAVTLWQQPTIRAAAAAQAAQLAEQNQLNLEDAGDVEAVLDEITVLDIPLFWDLNDLPTTLNGWGLKVLGLIISWVAAVQGAPFWYDVLKKLKPS